MKNLETEFSKVHKEFMEKTKYDTILLKNNVELDKWLNIIDQITKQVVGDYFNEVNDFIKKSN